ncbi:hypothetical protein PGTUg99_028377 [Puccinia graminis f. sp. tritici]|uniref:Uncharacterized protein n=1 Tax=Puccinia graminis f. sp. tritici TaxID=56615 RepID=A0A5B0LT07_PUCGR|nr:hypothetical protein PGTUg99_028377 [Puccinia graminis f. sp. tritici]
MRPYPTCATASGIFNLFPTMCPPRKAKSSAGAGRVTVPPFDVNLGKVMGAGLGHESPTADRTPTDPVQVFKQHISQISASDCPKNIYRKNPKTRRYILPGLDLICQV